MESQPLNIGITCYPTYGGSGVIATEIGMEMARRGHRVHFICADVPRRLDRFMDNIFFHEVEVVNYPVFISPPYALALTSKMVEVATYEKLDILHVHYAVPHATSAFLAKKLLGNKAPKVITTLHGTDITLVGNERNYLPITRFSIMESDGVTAPSRYLKLATYDKLNVPTSFPIEIIPNFVDTAEFRPSSAGVISRNLQRYLACEDNNEKILVHVSNFRPVKRIPDVIEIFALVRAALPVRLVLIGDGPERSAAEELVREKQLSEHVKFLGKLESFAGILNQGDIFLLPSESESFGLAALEALSSGLPVIASKVGGLPEVVAHGKNGFLSEVGDVRAMADSALRLLQDPTLLNSFSQEARTSAIRNFELHNVANQYERYYQSVLTTKTVINV